MAQQPELHDQTVDYIRLELIAIIASSTAKFLIVIMVVLEWNKMLYLVLTVEMILSIGLDYLLISPNALNMGTIGTALSSIGRNWTVLLLCTIICWIKLGMTFNDLKYGYDITWIKRWTHVGAYSAVDSLVRNAVYLVVILRTMNQLEVLYIYFSRAF